LPTAGAELFVEHNTSVRLSLQGSDRTCPNTGRIVAPPTNHDAEISLYSALGLDLDRAILERDIPSMNATAGEHAAQAAYTTLGMGNLEAASSFWFGLCLFSSN
jgi:hypothetical protein